jgi:hypothetical protein
MMIASRMLTLRDDSSDIDTNAPEKTPDGSWGCRYEIDWPCDEPKMTIGGFDSMQALVLALLAIGAEIYSSNYH